MVGRKKKAKGSALSDGTPLEVSNENKKEGAAFLAVCRGKVHQGQFRLSSCKIFLAFKSSKMATLWKFSLTTLSGPTAHMPVGNIDLITTHPALLFSKSLHL